MLIRFRQSFGGLAFRPADSFDAMASAYGKTVWS
jgi:hypothetical protein